MDSNNSSRQDVPSTGTTNSLTCTLSQFLLPVYTISVTFTLVLTHHLWASLIFFSLSLVLLVATPLDCAEMWRHYRRQHQPEEEEEATGLMTVTTHSLDHMNAGFKDEESACMKPDPPIGHRTSGYCKSWRRSYRIPMRCKSLIGHRTARRCKSRVGHRTLRHLKSLVGHRIAGYCKSKVGHRTYSRTPQLSY